MQKPWGRTVPGVLEEQRGGPFGWSRESKGMHVDSMITPHNTPLRSCWPGRVMKKTLEDVAEVPARDTSK